jgi:UDP-glucose 4-epimerase
MSKILVTGGCGYIGSHTIVDLLNNGFEVVSIDNNIRSHSSVMDRVEQITGKKVINYSIDLCDKEKVDSFFEIEKDISGIIHFAALKSVPESVENPLLYYHNNIASLLNILEAAKANNITNFVFSSSCSVYGNTSLLPVTEETPFQKAECAYAHTKQIGEEIIQNFSKNEKGNFILLRYFNPVGAHETALIGEDLSGTPTNIIPRITGTAFGKYAEMKVWGGDYPTRDGTCVRDYIHVMDIANAHTKAMQYLLEGRNKNACEVFNLGTGNGVTVLEAIHSFEKVSGVKLNYSIGPRRDGDVVEIYADNAKAKKVLGWEITRDLDNMMLTAWKWQQQSIKSN